MQCIGTIILEMVFLFTLVSFGFGNNHIEVESFTDPDKEDIEPIIINRGPYFEKSVSKNVTALVGRSAYLNCRVRNLGNRTVTWIRHRDLHLLTVGRSTYISDQRFTSIHNPLSDDWTLQIRYPQQKDDGVYECQVGTTPPIGVSMMLSVVEPVTTLLGGPEMFINEGSNLNLSCVVWHTPESSPIIVWSHNNHEINYNSPRGGVSVITEKGDITISYLLVQNAKNTDSGTYTCSPSNANSKTILVHVINDEHSEPMQHGSQICLQHFFSTSLFLVLIAVLWPLNPLI